MRSLILLTGFFISIAGLDYAKAAAAEVPVTPTVMQKFISSMGNSLEGELRASAEACNQAGLTASKMCLTSMSPQIKSGALMVGGILAAMDVTAGSNETCKKFGDAMDIAKTAVAAYNTACGAAHLNCNMKCNKFVSDLVKDETALEAYLAKCSAAAAGSCPEVASLKADAGNINTAKAQVVKMLTTCESYKLQLAAAGLGLISLVKSSKQADKCDKQTNVAEEDVDCRLNPQDSRCNQVLDCSVEANRTTVECICRSNPNTPGCVSAGSRPDNNGNFSTNNGTNFSNAGGSGTPFLGGGGAGDLTDNSRAVKSSGADGSGDGSVGGAAGMGSGGGGLPLGGTGGGSANTAAGAKKLNANILQGYGDGGGGGGGSRGGGGSSDSDSQLGRYMPGGKNDPKRNVASKAVPGLTSSSGLSNWQKIKNRYSDNKPSLLGGP